VRPGQLSVLMLGRVIMGDIAVTMVDLAIRKLARVEEAQDGDWLVSSLLASAPRQRRESLLGWFLHGLTERSAGICELAQQLRQLTALVLRERREYPLLDFVDHMIERSQLLAPGGGDRDDVASPVAGVDRAFDQSESL
jgi:hypothetical protein